MVDAPQGKKAITFNYQSCPLDISSFRYLTFDVANETAVEATVDIQYNGRWPVHPFKGRGVALSGQHSKVQAVLQRPSMKKDSEGYQEFGAMRGFAGNHVAHWNATDLTGVKKITITVTWENYKGKSSEIRIKTPYGEGDYSFPSYSFDKLPRPLVDDLGQSVIGDWDGKLNDKAILKQFGKDDIKKYAGAKVDKQFSKYGGWKKGAKMKATGYFHTVKYEGKWWLVDPAGHLFWSQGITCVSAKSGSSPKNRENLFPTFEDDKKGTEWSLLKKDVKANDINFYGMNLKRKYGENWEVAHRKVSEGRLKTWGLNTTGAWSSIPETPTHPYTLIIHPKKQGVGSIHKIIDPFSPEFINNLRMTVGFIKSRKEDPYLVGIFVNNELHWGNERKIANEVLKLKNSVPARKAMEEFFQQKYKKVKALNKAWGSSFSSFESINDKKIKSYSEAFNQDMLAYFDLFADTYYRLVAEEVHKAMPNHLYLGSRLHEENFDNKIVQRAASRHCDVISFNIYHYSVDDFEVSMDVEKPCIIGEFHFGTATHGVWGTGLRSAAGVKNQADLYELYMKSALAHPSFIGAHWFQWVDQSTLGRGGDGENFRIGIVNITDQPYQPLVDAVQRVSESLYKMR